jgi:hypothetical protein
MQSIDGHLYFYSLGERGRVAILMGLYITKLLPGPWGVQGGRRRPQVACREGWPPGNGSKIVLGVVRPQGIEGLGMTGPGETLGSP